MINATKSKIIPMIKTQDSKKLYFYHKGPLLEPDELNKKKKKRE